MTFEVNKTLKTLTAISYVKFRKNGYFEAIWNLKRSTFIDEAYIITENDHVDFCGRECLMGLTKALEDCRYDLVVIIAGYTEPMNHFFVSNPGSKSRFNAFIEFPDYSAEELRKNLIKLYRGNDYVLVNDI